jgi:hypothetical protein
MKTEKEVRMKYRVEENTKKKKKTGGMNVFVACVALWRQKAKPE